MIPGTRGGFNVSTVTDDSLENRWLAPEQGCYLKRNTGGSSWSQLLPQGRAPNICERDKNGYEPTFTVCGTSDCE